MANYIQDFIWILDSVSKTMDVPLLALVRHNAITLSSCASLPKNATSLFIDNASLEEMIYKLV